MCRRRVCLHFVSHTLFLHMYDIDVNSRNVHNVCSCIKNLKDSQSSGTTIKYKCFFFCPKKIESHLKAMDRRRKEKQTEMEMRERESLKDWFRVIENWNFGGALAANTATSLFTWNCCWINITGQFIQNGTQSLHLCRYKWVPQYKRRAHS